MRGTPLERWLDKLEITEGCWWWRGARNTYGYGNFYFEGRVHGAHRVGYMLLRGPIPEGYEMDHVVCDNGPEGCVHPDHVEPVPVEGRINTVRHYANQTHCKWGHEFTDENTYRAPDGARSCKICRRTALAAYEERAQRGRHV